MNLKSALSLIREVPDFPQPGVLFRDITPLLYDAQGFSTVVDELCKLAEGASTFAGIEARGFIFASAMAVRSSAGFVPIRKGGKLPSAVYSESYSLEYGEAILEIHQDSLSGSASIVIVDDVLATGGTLEAAIKLVERAGGNVVAVVSLIEISALEGRDRLMKSFPKLRIDSLLTT